MNSARLSFSKSLFAVSALAVLWGFHEFLAYAPKLFMDPLEDLSYGWFVPVFSLYVVWRERREIAESVGEPSWLGLLATLPLILIGFIGTRGIQVRFSILALSGLCFTLPWTFFGWRTAKKVLFPAAFLMFCTPLATFLDVITVHLRLFSTATAFELLRAFGVDVIRRGTMLMSESGSFAIDVAAPCSGLRSVFALTALTAGYAYFTQPTWLRRAILFSFAVPLAIFGNIMRIITIVAVAAVGSTEFATGFYHDYSGYVVFLVAIAAMVAVGGLISKIAELKSGGAE